MSYFQTKNLAVGYNNKSIVNKINFKIERGELFCMIGANGSGKSTILKTLTRRLDRISGDILVEGKDIREMKGNEIAKKIAVVLTDKITTELLTCRDIISTGRYPYTGNFGKLTPKDEKIVNEVISEMELEEVAENDFTEISDGQRQRVLIARAICQETEIIVLDEPTSFLDIKHKIELLSTLRELAKKKNIAIIMALHEIDFALKACDTVACLLNGEIVANGKPENVVTGDQVRKIYNLKKGEFNSRFGSIEMPKNDGKAEIYVKVRSGYGIKTFRKLQKEGTPFACGILKEGTIDYEVASSLAVEVITDDLRERQILKNIKHIIEI